MGLRQSERFVSIPFFNRRTGQRQREFLREPSPQAASTIAVIEITVPTIPSESAKADITLLLTVKHYLSEYNCTAKVCIYLTTFTPIIILIKANLKFNIFVEFFINNSYNTCKGSVAYFIVTL